MTIFVEQTAESGVETYRVLHEDGVELQGWCRLSPITTDLEALRYIASNEDLIETIGVDLRAAREHYRQHGRFENRQCSFDALGYLASYPDLAVFGSDEVAACEHFIRYGRREGRFVQFKPLLYVGRNPDLRAVFGDDQRSAVEHYLKYGRVENRLTC